MDDENPNPYSLPDPDHDPAVIAARLMRHPVHQHLADNEVRIGYLMRCKPKDKGNKRELGSVHAVKTMFQGGFKDLGLMLLEQLLGDLPEFLIVLDLKFWNQATDEQRDALTWHELAHIQQRVDEYGAPRFDRDGLPVFGIVEHDVSAFRSEVERFGLWSDDLRAFVAVAREA